MHIDETELKRLILDSGLVSKKDIEEAARYAEEKNEGLGKVLVSRGVITEAVRSQTEPARRFNRSVAKNPSDTG